MELRTVKKTLHCSVALGPDPSFRNAEGTWPNNLHNAMRRPDRGSNSSNGWALGQQKKPSFLIAEKLGLSHMLKPPRPLEGGRNRGAGGSRTHDGGFAIRCLSHLATAPFVVSCYCLSAYGEGFYCISAFCQLGMRASYAPPRHRAENSVGLPVLSDLSATPFEWSDALGLHRALECNQPIRKFYPTVIVRKSPRTLPRFHMILPVCFFPLDIGCSVWDILRFRRPTLPPACRRLG